MEQNKITECTYCGNQLLDSEEIKNPHTDESGDIMCDHCYDENYREVCCLCEESYEKPTKPEETFFIIAKEVSGDVAMNDMKPGLYQCKEWPYFLGATGFGFEMLFENSVKLLREFDINKTLKLKNKLCGYYYDEFGANEVCDSCADNFLGKYKYVRYIDQFIRIHENINNRILIK